MYILDFILFSMDIRHVYLYKMYTSKRIHWKLFLILALPPMLDNFLVSKKYTAKFYPKTTTYVIYKVLIRLILHDNVAKTLHTWSLVPFFCGNTENTYNCCFYIMLKHIIYFLLLVWFVQFIYLQWEPSMRQFFSTFSFRYVAIFLIRTFIPQGAHFQTNAIEFFLCTYSKKKEITN